MSNKKRPRFAMLIVKIFGGIEKFEIEESKNKIIELEEDKAELEKVKDELRDFAQSISMLYPVNTSWTD